MNFDDWKIAAIVKVSDIIRSAKYFDKLANIKPTECSTEQTGEHIAELDHLLKYYLRNSPNSRPLIEKFGEWKNTATIKVSDLIASATSCDAEQ